VRSVFRSMRYGSFQPLEAPMERKRYAETQIMGILKEAEQGVPVTDLCRKHGMCSDAPDAISLVGLRGASSVASGGV